MLLEFDQYFQLNYRILSVFGVFVNNKHKASVAVIIVIFSNSYNILLALIQVEWLTKIGNSDTDLLISILTIVLSSILSIIKVNI